MERGIHTYKEITTQPDAWAQASQVVDAERRQPVSDCFATVMIRCYLQAAVRLIISHFPQPHCFSS